jgi:hypothetical protein
MATKLFGCVHKHLIFHIFLLEAKNNPYTFLNLKHLQLGIFLYFQSQARLQLQLAPSLEHQVAAMLSILARYNWRQFSVVTSEIAGHDDFVQAVRDRVAFMKSQDRPEPIR